MSTKLVAAASRALDTRTSRRGFLRRAAMVGTALVAAPTAFLLRPGSAYAAVVPSQCGSGARCNDGWTDFCCNITGVNTCPPGNVVAGWWRAEGNTFCDGNSRYYMDCNEASCSCCVWRLRHLCPHLRRLRLPLQPRQLQRTQDLLHPIPLRPVQQPETVHRAHHLSGRHLCPALGVGLIVLHAPRPCRSRPTTTTPPVSCPTPLPKAPTRPGLRSTPGSTWQLRNAAQQRRGQSDLRLRRSPVTTRSPGTSPTPGCAPSEW